MLTKLFKRLKIIKNKIQLSSGIRKRQKQDHNLSNFGDLGDNLGDFHRTAIKPFIHALIEEIKGAFNISNLPVLNVFLKLDAWGLPDRDSLLFESYGKEELKVLHDFYGTGKQDIFQGRMVQAPTLYDTQFSSLLLEFRNSKSYISQ